MHLLEQVNGGVVDGLDVAHVQQQEAAGSQVGFKLAEELVGGAEEQVALQFAEDRLIAVAMEYLPLGRLAAGFGGHLVKIAFAADDRTTDLITDEEQDRHGDADTGSRDQVNGQGHQNHTGNDAEIKSAGRMAQQVKHVLVEHPPGDHQQDSGQCADRNPGDQSAEQKQGQHDEDPLDNTQSGVCVRRW